MSLALSSRSLADLTETARLIEDAGGAKPMLLECDLSRREESARLVERASVGPGAGGAPVPYLATPFNEQFGFLSPDGKWLLYVSDESGSNQAYVQCR